MHTQAVHEADIFVTNIVSRRANTPSGDATRPLLCTHPFSTTATIGAIHSWQWQVENDFKYFIFLLVLV